MKDRSRERIGLKINVTIYLLCFETKLVHVPSNTWWLDQGAIIYVSHSKQGFLTNQSLSKEKNV